MKFPAKKSSDENQQLLLACRSGAARELFEETGIDMRGQLDRLEPAPLRKDPQMDEDGSRFLLSNELKHRLFYFLPVTDNDFATKGIGPVSGEGQNLKVSVPFTIHLGTNSSSHTFFKASTLRGTFWIRV